jgi:hypothetical protein
VKRLLKRRVLLVIPLVLVLLAGAALKLGIVHVPVILNVNIGGKQAEAAPQEPPERGIPISLGERVVNLADPGGFRYLKAEVVVELAVEGMDPEKMSPEELAHEQEALSSPRRPWLMYRRRKARRRSSRSSRIACSRSSTNTRSRRSTWHSS